MRQHERQMAHVIGVILAAATAPDPTQPPARVGDSQSPVAAPMQGTEQRRDEGNDETPTA